MIRKLVFRLVLAGFALFVILSVGLGVAIFLAADEPAFYAEMRDVTPTAKERADVKLRAEQIAQSMAAWTHFAERSRDANAEHENGGSVLLEGGPERWQVAFFGDTPLEPGVPSDPTADTWSITIDERELNTLLRLDEFGLDEKDRPVVRLLDNSLLLGFRVVASGYSGVLSCELRLSPTDDGDIRMDVVGGNVGRLPIPLAPLLKFLPKEASSRNRDLDLCFDAAIPHAVLHLDLEDRSHARLSALRIEDGRLLIEFERLATAPTRL